jgi:long-subunit acyl-CoA synthetase (AMP-forming)
LNVVSSYFGQDAALETAERDGWFGTGDVATIDPRATW